jgi:hypothetical protein
MALVPPLLSKPFGIPSTAHILGVPLWEQMQVKV